jgi:histidyl-tRNA synthetase
VEVNSIGDKESRTPYTRELTAYYRKHISQICVNCRQRMKTNPLRLLDCKSKECQVLKEKAPQSVAFLSPAAKTHFKEVLEFLDALKINYRINPHLVRGLDYYTHTVFEVLEEQETVETEQNDVEGATEKKEEQPLSLTIAAGGRYDYLAKRLGSKKDVPAVGVSIGVDRVLLSPSYKAVAPRIVKNPKVYFIQIGFEAKLKSLEVIEILRNARIPVMHSLNKDSLSAQLATAEKMEIPHAIIFGQKEALEGTVIVRNMLTRSQDTIKIVNLADYLKKIK